MFLIIYDLRLCPALFKYIGILIVYKYYCILNCCCNFQIMPRSQSTHAVVNAAFLYKLDNEIVRLARIAYGGLSAPFIRAETTEKYLTAKKLFTNDTFCMALSILKEELKVVENPPEPSVVYRKQLAINLFYKVKRWIVLFVMYSVSNLFLSVT